MEFPITSDDIEEDEPKDTFEKNGGAVRWLLVDGNGNPKTPFGFQIESSWELVAEGFEEPTQNRE